MGDRFLRVLLIAGLVLLASNCPAVDTSWTEIHYYGKWDTIGCMAETADSGLILVGAMTDSGESYTDLEIIKTDAIGQFEWRRTYGTEYQDRACHVLPTYDGGYLIGGEYGGVTGTGLLWVIKTDDVGDTLWSYTYSQPGFPLDAVQTSDSGYAITGTVYIPGMFNQAFILKLDQDGTPDWFHHYGDGRYQDGMFITQLEDDGYIVTGTYNTGYVTLTDWWAIRTDDAGGIVWDSIYPLSTSYDTQTGSCRVSDGIVMTGTVMADGWVHKIDFDGNTVWSKSISIYHADEANHDIVTTPDGGFMVGGWVGVVGHNRDFNFLRLNSVGDTLWTYQVGGGNNDHGLSLVNTSDGGYVLAGESMSFLNRTTVYMAKLDPSIDCCGVYVSGYTGNTTCDGEGKRNLADITQLIDRIYLSKLPLCCEENGNTDGDAEGKMNLADLTRLIDNVFLSKEETAACE